MNSSNRQFLTGLGMFFLLASALMLITGFWPGLRGFGVSERFFDALAWLSFGAGAVAVLTGVFSGRSKS